MTGRGDRGTGRGGELAYLGLGSNLGDRLAYLTAAIQRLDREPGVRVVRRSSIWETEPVGVTDQPSFLNAILEVETSLLPGALLRVLKEIERELGRRPARRWGERTIDLDLLLYGQETVVEPELVVPHPELWNRLFLLAPLAELAPDLRAPDGRSIQQVAASLERSQTVRPLAPLAS